MNIFPSDKKQICPNFKELNNELILENCIHTCHFDFFRTSRELSKSYPGNDKQTKYQPNKKQYAWDTEVLNKALEADFVQWKNDPNVNTEYTAYEL